MELRANLLKDIHYGSCGKFNIKEEGRKRVLLNVPDSKEKDMSGYKDTSHNIS